MTETRAELLLASKNKSTGIVLYTWRLTFPRSILSEINTHRMASRNTSSSRAIPSKKMRAAVLNDPFIPVSLGVNQKGMQAGAEIVGWRRKAILSTIKLGRYPVVFQAWLLDKLGAHKQVSNRILESYSWCTQIFSATDVDNLFKLRNHVAAEPHFHRLAYQMQQQRDLAEQLLNQATKLRSGNRLTYGSGMQLQILDPGMWHLPLLLPHEFYKPIAETKKVSAARCARTSYTLVGEGKTDYDADIKLCDRLFGGGHYSPFEHQAQAMDTNEYHANFKSFRQFRKEVEGEPTVSIPEVIKPKDAGLLGKVRELRPKAVTFQMEELKWYVLSGSPKLDKSWKIIGEGDCEVRALENALKVLESA